MMTVSAHAASLAGSEWALRDKPERFIHFHADGKVSGSSGCNNFAGAYEQNDHKLVFGPLAGTRKMCMGKIMEKEALFLKALAHTASMKRTKRNLTLHDRKGRLLLSLFHRDWD